MSKRRLLDRGAGAGRRRRSGAGRNHPRSRSTSWSFSPAEVSAKVGDTIEWVNKDAFAHTATVKGGWEVMIPPKKSAKPDIEDGGTVDYFCRFHPNMKGRLVVAP